MTNLSGATTAVFTITLSAALEVPVNVAWQTKDGTAKAGTDYEAASGSVTFEPGETAKQIQVVVYGRAEGDTENRTFGIELYPPENAILDQTLTEVSIQVADENGVAVTSIVVATGPRGIKGDPGLSSYQLAKLQGYEGTLEEYILQETAAGISADRAEDEADRAKTEADRADEAAGRAENVSDSVNTFRTKELGLAGTTNGQTFRVPQGVGADQSFIYYENRAGVAYASADQPGKALIDAVNVRMDNANKQIVANTEIASLSLSTFSTFSAPGTIPISAGVPTALRIEAVTANPVAPNKVSLTYTQDGKTRELIKLKPSEYISGKTLYSPYRRIDLSRVTPAVVLLDAVNSVARVIYDSTVITLQGAFASSTRMSLFSRDDLFKPIVATTTDYSYTEPCCGLRDATTAQLTIPYSKITAAGYPATVDGVKDYLAKEYQVLVFDYYTSTNYVAESPIAIAADLTASDAVLNAPSASFSSISGDVRYWNGVTKDDKGYNPFTRFVADVVNDTANSYTGLVELKISFPQGVVYGHNGIKVSDSDGNSYQGQFAGEEFVNLRFQSNEGFHPDGSFKTGSVWIYDTIAAGERKSYNVDAYGYSYDNTKYPDLAYYANIEANKRYNLTVGGLTYRFSWGTYYYGLASIDALPNDDTNRVRVGISPQYRYLNAGSSVIEYFTENVSLKVVNSGPLFTEVERIAYNAGNAILAAGVLKAVTKYRIFNTGQVLVKNTITALQEIPVGKLYGATVPVNMYYQAGVTPVFSFQSPAAITASNLIGNGNFSIVPTIVNGDIHRDGTAGGPTRPTTIGMTNTPAQNLMAVTAGWAFTSTTDYSLLNWPVEKNWTWSVEMWLNANETATDHFALATKVFNRPVGMASQGQLPNFAVKIAEDDLLLFMEAVADFWMNGDTSGIGGMTPPFNFSNPSNLTPFGYLAYRELVKKNGTLAALLPAFTKYLDVNYNGTGLGAAYISGSRSIADLVATVFKPLSTFYRVAEALGETAVTNALKPYIASVADAMVTTVTNKGGITNYYTDSGTGATNINVYGLLTVALAIHAGMDTTGKYQTCYNTVIALITDKAAIFRYAPSLLDSQPVTTSLSRSRWYNYDMDLAAEYLIMNDMLGGTPAFNNITYGLHGLCGDGRIRTIDYIISESRRGIISTPVSVALAMMMVRRVSTGNAAMQCVKAYREDYMAQPYAASRFYDHSPRLATGIPTTVSSHNRVILEMLAGYFVNQLVKGKSVGSKL